VDQRGPHVDCIREFVEISINRPIKDLESIRKAVVERILQAQQKQKLYYGHKHKAPTSYQVNDLRMLRNFDSTLGAAKKLILQFRGPYKEDIELRRY